MSTDDTWPTVKCGLWWCRRRLRMRSVGSDEYGNGGTPDYSGTWGKGDQYCSRRHRLLAEKRKRRRVGA